MNIFTTENMMPFFSFLDECESVRQSPVHHPEGNVLIHSLQVFNVACKESDDIDLILAALLHDIGKIVDSKKHEIIALDWLNPYCSVKTLFLIEQHMRIWGLIKGEMKKRRKLEFLINHCWLPELLMLARWDKIGRNPTKKPDYKKELIIEKLNKKVEIKFKIRTLT